MQSNLTMSSKNNNRALAMWLLTVCALIFVMVVLGGVTRLTRSGLSMVEWDPIMGIIPPLSTQQWQESFDKYKQFPEYQRINVDLDLAGFKSIFWFEYSHRVLGRIIGLAFLLPLLYFLFRRKIPGRLTPQLITMFILGGLQGLLGWYMVKSGLVDNPHVSQYRLTAHLIAAMAIYSYILWVALGLVYPDETPGNKGKGRRYARNLTWLIVLMIISGGFVAGTRAGFAYNTFPLMAGHWLPPGLFDMQPWYRNLFENIVTVQFDHRLIGYLLCILIPVYWWRHGRHAKQARIRIGSLLMVAMLVIQVGLGVSTLLLHVPVGLAASHQGGALVLLSLALFTNHGYRSN